MPLPQGWVEVKLGELLDSIVGGGTPTKTKKEYFIGNIPFVTVKDFISPRPLDTVDHINEIALLDSASQLIPANTLLMTTRMSIAKIALFEFPVAINQDIKALFVNANIEKLFIEKTLNLLSPVLIGNGTGTTVKGIRLENIKDLIIPLPPINEQQRIVSKLDAILVKVQSAQAHLDKIPPLLKRTRQAILSATFSQFKSHTYMKLDEIAEISGGLTKNSQRNDLHLQMPYLRVANVYANRLDLTEVKKIGVKDTEINRTLLKVDDLLFVEGNGSVDQIGRVALWDGSIDNCLHQNHLIKVRLLEPSSAKFILYFFLSPVGRDQIVDKASSTTGLNTLSISKISNLVLPFPELHEQIKSIKYIEILFERIDNIEAAYQEAREKVDAITQNVLAKAFRGELVEQDPNDEPASVLLERIKNEKEWSKSNKAEKSVSKKDKIKELILI